MKVIFTKYQIIFLMCEKFFPHIFIGFDLNRFILQGSRLKLTFKKEVLIRIGNFHNDNTAEKATLFPRVIPALINLRWHFNRFDPKPREDLIYHRRDNRGKSVRNIHERRRRGRGVENSSTLQHLDRGFQGKLLPVDLFWGNISHLIYRFLDLLNGLGDTLQEYHGLLLDHCPNVLPCLLAGRLWPHSPQFSSAIPA